MDEESPSEPLGEYEGTEHVLNAQLMDWLRRRRLALAIETRGDRWAAIIRKTVRAWPSTNDFAVISGHLFQEWDERLTTRDIAELAVKATLPEAQAFLDEWKRSPT